MKTIEYLKSLILEDKKLMIVMVGPPGSGKSTFIQSMKDNGIIFSVASTDALIDKLALENGLTYSEAFNTINFKEINREFKNSIREYINNGYNFVIDRTHMGEKSRCGYFDMIRNNGYTSIALNMKCDDVELRRRIDERAAATGKNIPDYVMEDMISRYEEPTYHEGFNIVINVDEQQ